MGSLKYANLSTLAFHLLAITTSNADSERVFNLVRRIKIDFRSSLSPETVSALIECHTKQANAVKLLHLMIHCLLKQNRAQDSET